MTKIDFYKLSRAIQDSLLDSLHSRFAPLPIVLRLGTRRTVEAWLAVAAVAAALLVALCVSGFGDVSSGLALHPSWVVGLYALLTATAVIGVLNAVAYRARAKALPFPAGVFLFPASVIDAREYVLRVYPLEQVTSVSAGRSGEVVVTFGIRRFSFPVPVGTPHTPGPDPSRMQETVQAVEAARDHMREPLEGQERRRLDPLAAPVVASPLTPEVPRQRTASRLEKQGLLAGALLGAVVGAATFVGRNSLSDSRMLAWAKARDDVASYKSYLARGRYNRDVVSQVLLPRASLRAAIASSSVDAIDAFIVEYPTTGIRSEIDAARRTALVQEFERARAAGTFAALLGFAEKYPEHGFGAVYDQAKHALYLRALARYRKETSDQVSDFLGRLVASSEKVGPKKTPAGYRGPVVQVRFRRVPSKDMDNADELVRKNPMFNGTPSLPSGYLDAAHLEPHERAASEALGSGIAGAFDPEIVTFEPGPPLESSSGDLPPMTAPTLVVSYHVETSGTAFASKKPRGIFLGLVYFFTTDFVLPGDTHPLHTKLAFTQRIPTDMLRDAPASAPGALESAVYEAMTRDAFATYRDKYLAIWGKKDAPKP